MIEISWSQFKDFVDTGSASPIYLNEPGEAYSVYLAMNGLTFKTYLRADSSELIEFEAGYKDFFNLSLVTKSQSRFERDDIRLKMSRSEAAFSSGEAEVSFKLPGEVGVDKVFIGGGYAFTDVFTFGDCVEKIQVVDVDNILGLGAHYVVATYHDETEAAANAGWYMWPSPQAGGEIEVEPLGFYGEAVAGLYLELYFKATAATKIYVDFTLGRLV